MRKAEESRIRKITKTRQPLIYNLLIHGPTSAHPWTPCPHFTCFLAVPSLSPSPLFFSITFNYFEIFLLREYLDQLFSFLHFFTKPPKFGMVFIFLFWFFVFLNGENDRTSHDNMCNNMWVVLI